MSACGGTSGASTDTPTPVLAQEYVQAAHRANTSLLAMESHLDADCQTLDACRLDYFEFAQIENSFVSDLRAIKVPSRMEADVNAVIDIEKSRITIAEDAAQATSLDQISQDVRLITALRPQFDDAINRLRVDLGLPKSTQTTPTPSQFASPSTSASPVPSPS